MPVRGEVGIGGGGVRPECRLLSTLGLLGTPVMHRMGWDGIGEHAEASSVGA